MKKARVWGGSQNVEDRKTEKRGPSLPKLGLDDRECVWDVSRDERDICMFNFC